MNSTDNDKKKYTKYIINYLSLKSNGYAEFNINQIIFSYGIKDGIIESNIQSNNPLNKSITQNYKHYKLPVTLDPLAYGKLINTINLSTKDNNIIQYYIQVTSLTLFIINQSIIDDKIINKVSVFRDGDKVLEYIDTFKNNDTNFVRIIGQKIYYYSLDGKLEYFYHQKNTNYISRKIVDQITDEQDKIITLDIETFEEKT